MGLRRYTVNIGPPIEISSLDEPGLWAGDIVAGAFRHAFTTGERECLEALRPSYIGEGY